MLLPARTNSKEQDIFRTISITALLSGLLQLTAAIIQPYFNSANVSGAKLTGQSGQVSLLDYLTNGGPQGVCRDIAKAVFDPSTNEKLLLAWGIVFHFMIAFIFTLVLFLLYTPVARTLRNRLIIAVFYGMITSLIMNLIVIPLTNLAGSSFDFGTILTGGIVLTFTLGLPVAWKAGRHYDNKLKD